MYQRSWVRAKALAEEQVRTELSMEQRSTRLSRVDGRPKLADEIAQTLRQAILRGVYERGEKLTLEELASELGVSIMPVREALIALSNERLVIAEPRRGFRANPLSQSDLDDIVEIQSHLAGILAARAAKEATEDDVTKLREIHHGFADATEIVDPEERAEQLEELNDRFHRQINKIPSGERIRWFLRLTNQFVRHDLFDVAPDMVERALKDHPAIIDAIAEEDSASARELMVAHFAYGAHLGGGIAHAVGDI